MKTHINLLVNCNFSLVHEWVDGIQFISKCTVYSSVHIEQEMV